MEPERSGRERRKDWVPTCAGHEDMIVRLTRVITTVRLWGTILSVVWGVGVGIVGWAGIRIMGFSVAIELSAADRKVIHEEIKTLEARIVRLEQCRFPQSLEP